VAGDTSYDAANPVGVGDYYVAIGDGLTLGFGDDDPTDDNSQDGRTRLGGYTSILADALTSSRGYPVTVVNEAVGGTASADAAASIQALLEKHPEAQVFLTFWGHNDALQLVPSGLGLQPGQAGYTGSFKANMQSIINALNAAGKSLVIAKAPPVLPLNSDYHARVQEYNMVVEELAADPGNGLIPPPDFHTYFETRTTTHYAGNEILNGLGYRDMAQLWFEALTQ
jgi:lysophospholipase L1-like esterase